MSLNIENLLSCPLAFGGASISGEGGGYGFGDISESDALSLVRYSIDRGVRVFDTAPIYGFGESERRLGKALKAYREKCIIVSKSGVHWKPSKRVDMTNDPATTQLMLEDSLRRLNTDYIDLYMIHWPDPRVDIRRPMEVLSKAKSKGQILSIGLCNTTPEDFKKAGEVDSIEVLQGQLNIFSTDEMFPFISKEKLDIPFMSWGTLDKGIIAGTVKKDRVFHKSDCRSWAPWWKKSNKNEKIDQMKPILSFLEKSGHRGIELALAYNLLQKGCRLMLCGAKTPSQLDELFSAMESLPSEEIVSSALEMLNEN